MNGRCFSEDFLVFLTGSEEIEQMKMRIREIAGALLDAPRIDVRPLYAAMSADAQISVFQPVTKAVGVILKSLRMSPLQNCRKIVLATNIAETSLTIAGIRHVIDCGRVKQKQYDAQLGLDLLRVERVSQAQACQRAGRAGREAPGCVYRLYTEQTYAQLAPATTADIERCNLVNVVLELVALGIDDILTFDFMSRPQPAVVRAAVAQLVQLGALEYCTDEAACKVKLTDIGRTMSDFPVDPPYAKCILASAELGCVDAVVSIVAMMTQENIFLDSAKNVSGSPVHSLVVSRSTTRPSPLSRSSTSSRAIT